MSQSIGHTNFTFYNRNPILQKFFFLCLFVCFFTHSLLVLMLKVLTCHSFVHPKLNPINILKLTKILEKTLRQTDITHMLHMSTLKWVKKIQSTLLLFNAISLGLKFTQLCFHHIPTQTALIWGRRGGGGGKEQIWYYNRW